MPRLLCRSVALAAMIALRTELRVFNGACQQTILRNCATKEQAARSLAWMK
jgi:hypothetical protein